MSGAVKILFVSLLDDPGSERLVAEMGRSGAVCEVAAAASSFPARTRFARRVYRLTDIGGPFWRAFLLARRLNGIVARSAPDLILPLDELAAGVLRDPRALRRADARTRRLLIDSLGAPEGFPAARSRRRLSALATDLGLTAPRTLEVADLAAARRAGRELGYPLVVKRELTAGGGGILMARDEAALVSGFRRSQLAARAKSCLGWIEGYRGEDISHVAQEFIAGDLAFRNSVCRDGVELAGFNLTAERRDPFETAPSRRIHGLRNAEMEASARAVIGALGLSGFVSFDFIVDKWGRAHLLELNPRATGSTHLGKLFGADLIGALLGAPEAPSDVEPISVALFPKAIDGDPYDPALWGLTGLLHDVPWEDPELLDSYAGWLAKRHPEASRVFAQLRVNGRPSPFMRSGWQTSSAPLRSRSAA